MTSFLSRFAAAIAVSIGLGGIFVPASQADPSYGITYEGFSLPTLASPTTYTGYAPYYYYGYYYDSDDIHAIGWDLLSPGTTPTSVFVDFEIADSYIWVTGTGANHLIESFSTGTLYAENTGVSLNYNYSNVHEGTDGGLYYDGGNDENGNPYGTLTNYFTAGSSDVGTMGAALGYGGWSSLDPNDWQGYTVVGDWSATVYVFSSTNDGSHVDGGPVFTLAITYNY